MNFSNFIKKHHIISIIFQLAAFAMLFTVSKLWLGNLYLFDWTARNYYCFVWVIACLFSFFGKNMIGVSITVGAVLGVFIAEPLGEYIRSVNMSKITEDTDAQRQALLSVNPAWYIWFIMILAAFFVGILVTVIRNLKNKRKINMENEKIL